MKIGIVTWLLVQEPFFDPHAKVQLNQIMNLELRYERGKMLGIQIFLVDGSTPLVPPSHVLWIALSEIPPTHA